MKTAISVDDDLLRNADRTAQKLGISRSRLFSIALDEFLKHRREEELLEQLNRAYRDGLDRSERKLLSGMRSKFRTVVKDQW
jgi:metal-responsive CopG/Arc/MetJ family transcriptional regulator